MPLSGSGGLHHAALQQASRDQHQGALADRRRSEILRLQRLPGLRRGERDLPSEGRADPGGALRQGSDREDDLARMGGVLALARDPRRGRGADLPQASVARLRGGEGAGTLDAELHRRGDQAVPQAGPERTGVKQPILRALVVAAVVLATASAAHAREASPPAPVEPVAVDRGSPPGDAAPASVGAETPEPANPVRIFPAEEVRPGLVGVARTVFQGDRLEEFQVEILGVLKNAIGPQQDMILARLKGEKVEFTGVVAGMSGSPVYIDGRLVGALSYRIGQFAKEPIAGITPIADMIKVAPAPATKSAAGPGGRPVDLLGWLERGADPALRPVTGAPATTAMAGSASLQPIAMPLVCAGCDPQALRHYAPIFEAMGLEPTA